MPLKDCLPFVHRSITTAQMSDDEFEMEKENNKNYLNRVDHVRVKYLEMIDPNTFWMAFKDDHNNVWRLRVSFPNYQVLPVIKNDDFRAFLEDYLASTANQKGCHLLAINHRDYEHNLVEGELYSFTDSKKENSLTSHMVMNAKAVLKEDEPVPEEPQPTPTPEEPQPTPAPVTIPPPPPTSPELTHQTVDELPDKESEEGSNEDKDEDK